MIDEGTLTLGEQCAPHTLTKQYIVNGLVETKQETVYGRKIPLKTLREKLLLKQRPYMRLHTEEALNNMSKEDFLQLYKQLNIQLPEETSLKVLKLTLMKYERTRTLAIWHDHATIASKGYILVTVKVVYDRAVFLDDSEISPKIKKNIQAIVEEPEIHILALSSSSQEDQAALITDRNACLQELCTDLTTTEGMNITDKLFFFCGDKPATQFERGTQQGGNYKCGSCGCKTSLMDDLAYSLTCKWRSLSDLQDLVTSGEFLWQQSRKYVGISHVYHI